MFPPPPTHLQVLLNSISNTNEKLLTWPDDYNLINKALLDPILYTTFELII